MCVSHTWLASFNAQEKPSNPYFAPATHNALKTEDISNLHQAQIQVDEFPERPGEFECLYYMKTGYCKFKAACKFHHPKNRPTSASAFILNSAGLPLRPVSLHPSSLFKYVYSAPVWCIRFTFQICCPAG